MLASEITRVNLNKNVFTYLKLETLLFCQLTTVAVMHASLLS